MKDISIDDLQSAGLVFVPDNLHYDSVRDIRAVDPYGFINLREAFVNGSVPTVVEDTIANYNGIDDPSSIVGTPSDRFEAFRMRDAILAAGKVSETANGSDGGVISKDTTK